MAEVKFGFLNKNVREVTYPSKAGKEKGNRILSEGLMNIITIKRK
ncbi:MAG: hypothetical protein ABF991_00385 [Liquorilactobacillus hordei]